MVCNAAEREWSPFCDVVPVDRQSLMIPVGESQNLWIMFFFCLDYVFFFLVPPLPFLPFSHYTHDCIPSLLYSHLLQMWALVQVDPAVLCSLSL